MSELNPKVGDCIRYNKKRITNLVGEKPADEICQRVFQITGISIGKNPFTGEPNKKPTYDVIIIKTSPESKLLVGQTDHFFGLDMLEMATPKTHNHPLTTVFV